MPKLSPDILQAIWERATEEELGLVIEVTDPVLLRQKLWSAKPDGEEFAKLMTFCPEGRKEVFIVRKSVELPNVED